MHRLPANTPARRLRRFALAVGILLPLALTAACDRAGSAGASAAEAQELAQQAEAERIAAAVGAALQADAATASIADDTLHAEAMRAIDTSACPPDFRAAYLEHIFAWERYARIGKAVADLNSDDSVKVTLALSAANALFGGEGTPIRDHLQAYQRLEALREEAAAEIRTTYQRVQVVATGHGATLPTA